MLQTAAWAFASTSTSSVEQPTASRQQALPRAGDFPGHVRIFAGMASTAWKQALMLLLTGSRKVPEGTDFEMPYYRDFWPRGYTLIHNDMDGGEGDRALCVNLWLPTSGWQAHWGGSFLWCGPPGDGTRFPEAERIPVAFNLASLFVPHSVSAWHAVDAVVGEQPGDEHHRFSLTSWLRVPRRRSRQEQPGILARAEEL